MPPIKSVVKFHGVRTTNELPTSQSNPLKSTLAVAQNGEAYWWGPNFPIVNGSASTPQYIGSLAGYVPPGQQALTDNVALGSNQVLALLTVGGAQKFTSRAGGYNGSGGTGILDEDHLGVVFDDFTNPHPLLTQVVANSDRSAALDANGNVWVWGYNLDGKLGIAGTQNLQSPTKVPGLPPMSRIAMGPNCFLAVATDGHVWSWGDAEFVAHDPASTASPSVPAPVVGLYGITDVSCAGYENYALRNDGVVLAWGNHINSSIPNGDASTSLPIAVTGFDDTAATQSTLGTTDAGDSWYFQNFSVPELVAPDIVADTADPDHDGISNLVEYALGLDPRAANPPSNLPMVRIDNIAATAQSESSGGISLFSLPTVDLTEGKHYMALTVQRHADIRQDIDYLIEVSPDLQTWQSGDPHTVTVLDTPETLEVYDAIATEDAPQRFIRLRIQRK